MTFVVFLLFLCFHFIKFQESKRPCPSILAGKFAHNHQSLSFLSSLVLRVVSFLDFDSAKSHVEEDTVSSQWYGEN